MASDEIYTLDSGAAVLLIWKPQGDANGYSYPEGIWNDTRIARGGQATNYFATSKAFKDFFGPGTGLYKTTASTRDVTIIASPLKMMLVNHLATPQIVVVNGSNFTLNPYEMLVTDTR